MMRFTGMLHSLGVHLRCLCIATYMPHVPVTHCGQLRKCTQRMLVWLQHALHGQLAAFCVLAFLFFLHPCMSISHMM